MVFIAFNLRIDGRIVSLTLMASLNIPVVPGWVGGTSVGVGILNKKYQELKGVTQIKNLQESMAARLLIVTLLVTDICGAGKMFL